MISRPTIAAIRFGAGLSPVSAPPADAAALWDSLAREQAGAAPYPIAPWDTRLRRALERRTLRRARGEADDPDLQAQLRAVNVADRDDTFADLRASLARLAYAESGLFERFNRFWANHFAARPMGGHLRAARAAYANEALRPQVMASFPAMLRSAILHPVMLAYLDQNVSVGPQSRAGRRQGRGLNENLARELLELHTLGVAGSYTQNDVTQLARLLTGLTFTLGEGFRFNANIAEPGIIEIFGKRYGARIATLDHILEVLDDLALHPDTATHLSCKLATHFVSDTPDPELIAHMSASFVQSQGSLPALYRAMLEHPAAWENPLAKTRAPFEMMAASLRALAVDPALLTGLRPGETRRLLLHPLQLMGEPHEDVPSPAGYGDAASYWITPQGLASRVDWAMALAQFVPVEPDPREFVETAMADAASAPLRAAAAGAETRVQGIGLILASPEFNRR